MIRFPSIEQYRSAIRNVSVISRSRSQDALPTIKYRGTVKLHGTNAGIVYDCRTTEFSFQSRERELSLDKDNSGFMLSMLAKTKALQAIIDAYIERECWIHDEATGTDKITCPHPDKVVLFGEWCGEGIQRGVAISQLPKMFVIFAVQFITDEDNRWLTLAPAFSAPDDRIYCIEQFPHYDLAIDFQRPDVAQQKMVEITEAVERCCPVGKYFGVDGVGEGVVWRSDEPSWAMSDLWFTVKGEKHSVSKVKTLAPVDVETASTIYEFVDRTVTEQRFLQGVSWLREQHKPMEMSSMGDFIRWVLGDIIKEEQDVIVASQIDPKKLGHPVSGRCRSWFINYLNTTVPTVV